jgi:hypothetical protein
MSSGRQPKPSEQSSEPTFQQKKLSRKRERGSEELSGSKIGSNNHEGGKRSKVRRTKMSGFPCPFALRDPAKYGGENGCSNYSRPIGTVIRVIGTHCQIVSYSDDLRSITSLASIGRSTRKLVMEKATSLIRSRS